MTDLSPHFIHTQKQNSTAGKKNRLQQRDIQIRGVTIKTNKKTDPKPAAKTKPNPAPAATPTQERERISARELHKYVIGSLGILMLFALGYTSALYRLDRSEKLVPLMSERTYSIDG